MGNQDSSWLFCVLAEAPHVISWLGKTRTNPIQFAVARSAAQSEVCAKVFEKSRLVGILVLWSSHISLQDEIAGTLDTLIP